MATIIRKDSPRANALRPAGAAGGVQLRRHARPGERLPRNGARAKRPRSCSRPTSRRSKFAARRKSRDARRPKRRSSASSTKKSPSAWTRCCPRSSSLSQQINDAKGELQSHWERSALKVVDRDRRADHPPRDCARAADHARLDRRGAATGGRLGRDHAAHQSDRLRKPRLADQAAGRDAVPTRAERRSWPIRNISAGGCRVETKFGEIDQQIESQLRRIEEDLA